MLRGMAAHLAADLRVLAAGLEALGQRCRRRRGRHGRVAALPHRAWTVRRCSEGQVPDASDLSRRPGNAPRFLVAASPSAIEPRLGFIRASGSGLRVQERWRWPGDLLEVRAFASIPPTLARRRSARSTPHMSSAALEECIGKVDALIMEMGGSGDAARMTVDPDDPWSSAFTPPPGVYKVSRGAGAYTRSLQSST